MQKIKDWLYAHRCFFSIFLGVCLYEFIMVRAGRISLVSPLVYPFYTLDYSMGFASRILPGAVYRLIVGKYTQEAVTAYHVVLLLVFFLVLSILMEKFLLAMQKEDRKLAGLVVFLFLTGSLTFSMFVYNIGVLETHWVFIAVFFFIFLKFKFLQPLIVPLCILEILVNFSAIMTYVPFFCILLLYELSFAEKKSEKVRLLSVFGLCVCVSFVLFFYLLMNEQKNMVYSYDEFHELLVSRGVEYFMYPEYFLYKRLDGEAAEVMPLLDAFNATELLNMYEEGTVGNGMDSLIASVLLQIRGALALGNYELMSRVLFLLILSFPVLFLIYRFLFRGIRDKGICRLRRFCYFSMGTMFFITYLLSLLLSTDNVKWLAYAFIPLMASFVYVMYTEKERVAAYLSESLASVPFPAILIYSSLYAGTVVGPYH